VKGCGRRPITKIAAGTWAGVRKPPRKEPAGSFRCGRFSARYGDLIAAMMWVQGARAWRLGDCA
jgi:hypothetical protein